ncbi:GT-D fold domain-containing glycosyltransferase [Leuconostoc mesenteroides]|uniref:GT-D fold domain-containing glycosyltransferase n=1 Tax=Leuconostoc mesenteroides TaxID=1245 RepID=UPI002362C7C8|nr:GT-D fold domain-containing glycosyltransferase [Leuconostoc mesenteroides]
MFGWGKVGKSYQFCSNTKRWYNNKGLIVEGEKTNFGYDNDLLGTAAAVSKIIVPSKNAFSKYEQILELTRETIKTYDKKT